MLIRQACKIMIRTNPSNFIGQATTATQPDVWDKVYQIDPCILFDDFGNRYYLSNRIVLKLNDVRSTENAHFSSNLGNYATKRPSPNLYSTGP